MLLELKVQNLAIIESVTIKFGPWVECAYREKPGRASRFCWRL